VPSGKALMRVVVTGAAGLLGRELCRQLGPAAIALAAAELDVTDPAAVQRTLGRLRPEVVVNCAAYTDVDRAESEPARCREVNAAAVEHLARTCEEIDAVLVQISTDYVFGQPPQPRVPWRETDAPSPTCVYGRTKLAGEQAAATCLRHLIVRTAGLYAGPSDARSVDFVRTMLRLADTGRTVRVVDDQHCTPSYVPHVARAIAFLAGRAAAGDTTEDIVHVTNRGATTWYGFAREVFRLAGADVELQPVSSRQYGAAAPRPPYSVLDTSAYHALDGPPMPPWEEALAESLQHTSLTDPCRLREEARGETL